MSATGNASFPFTITSIRVEFPVINKQRGKFQGCESKGRIDYEDDDDDEDDKNRPYGAIATLKFGTYQK